MAKASRARRERGSIELRGDSYRVKVNAGLDPLTGRRLYLSRARSRRSTPPARAARTR
jgi:hypothetical protein